MVSSLCHHDPNPAILFPLADEVAGNGLGSAIFEHHASFKPHQLFLFRNPCYLHPIRLRNREPGMGQEMGKVPVIGKKKKSFGIEIEATYRIDSPFQMLNKIQNRRPTLWVFDRGKIASRFIEKKNDLRFK